MSPWWPPPVSKAGPGWVTFHTHPITPPTSPAFSRNAQALINYNSMTIAIMDSDNAIDSNNNDCNNDDCNGNDKDSNSNDNDAADYVNDNVSINDENGSIIPLCWSDYNYNANNYDNDNHINDNVNNAIPMLAGPCCSNSPTATPMSRLMMIKKPMMAMMTLMHHGWVPKTHWYPWLWQCHNGNKAATTSLPHPATMDLSVCPTTHPAHAPSPFCLQFQFPICSPAPWKSLAALVQHSFPALRYHWSYCTLNLWAPFSVIPGPSYF